MAERQTDSDSTGRWLRDRQIATAHGDGWGDRQIATAHGYGWGPETDRQITASLRPVNHEGHIRATTHGDGWGSQTDI